MELVPLEKRIGSFLRAELKRKKITSKDLSNRLAQIGITEKPATINNKISRGTFSATWFVHCLKVIGYEKSVTDI